MPTRRKKTGPVKTSLQLPEELWLRAKVYAAEHRTDLRGVIVAALEAFLPKPKGGTHAK
jgi:hypothetical protein